MAAPPPPMAAKGPPETEVHTGMFRSAAKSNTEAFKIFEQETGTSIADYENVLDDAPARLLVLATTFGRRLVKTITERRDYTHLIKQEAGREGHVTMSLLEVNDVPVIDYWLTFATKCKKLQPLENSVYVICNEDNFAEHIAWCETQEFNHMKTEHIFSNGRTSTDPRQSQAEDIKVFREKSGWMGNLHVIDADYLFEPDFNLQRIVEHSAVLDCDCLTVMAPPGAAPEGVYSPTMFQDHGVCAVNMTEQNPTVTEFSTDIVNVSQMDDDHRCVCPLYYFKSSTLDLLGTVYDTSTDAHKGLSPFLAFIVDSGRPVKSHVVDYYFNVRNLDSFLFADQFFAYHAREELRKKKLMGFQDTDSNIEFAANANTAVDAQKADDMAKGKALARSQSQRVKEVKEGTSFRDEVVEYAYRFYAALAGAKTDAEHEERVPERFSDAAKFRHKAKEQHPVYRTSNNDYGRKAPGQMDMPMNWNGLNGEFTTSFHNMKYHFTGFNCSKTSSKIHNTMDDF